MAEQVYQRTPSALVTIKAVNVEHNLVLGWAPFTGDLEINVSAALAGVLVYPDIGEQWIIEKHNNAVWFLSRRLAFQNPNTVLPVEPGSVIIGSSGHVYLTGLGTVVESNSLTLGGVEYRTENGVLETKASGTWAPVCGH